MRRDRESRDFAVLLPPNSIRVVVTLVAQTRPPMTGQLVDIDIRDQGMLERGKIVARLCGSAYAV
jgi:hypothetical protein